MINIHITITSFKMHNIKMYENNKICIVNLDLALAHFKFSNVVQRYQVMISSI
jgi:hypothetical protein